MTAAPLLAALLRAALPGLRALDLGLPEPLLFPWLPGTLCGVADAATLPPAEAALLRRFRHPDGRPLVGLDRTADAALFAAAPEAWHEAEERLIRCGAAVPRHPLPADALLLVPPDAAHVSGAPTSRMPLLLGAGGTVERHDLLVPQPRLHAIHTAFARAAEALAEASDGRWLARSPAVSAEIASVSLLPENGQTCAPALSLPADALVHDRPASRAGPDGLDLSVPPHRVRVLLGSVPARLRITLRGDASGAALFGDGARLPIRKAEGPEGETCLEAEAWPRSAGVAVLGVALPRPARAVLARLDLLP